MFENVLIEKEANIKSSTIVYTHDHHTTMAFGEVQPINCQDLEIPGHSHFRISSLHRAFPLISPVFGRIAYKTFHNFVGLSEVFKPYKNILANKQSLTVNDNGTFEQGSIYKFPTCHGIYLAYELTKHSEYSIFYRVGNDLTKEFSTDIPLAYNMPISEVYERVFSENVSDKWYDIWVNGLKWRHDAEAVLPSESDYSIYFEKEVDGMIVSYIVCFKLSNKNRRLLNVLRGLGYLPSFKKDERVNQEVIRLLAWYRAYFCNFGVPQMEDWENTYCYQLIEYFGHKETVDGLFSLDYDYDDNKYLHGIFSNFLHEELAYNFYLDNKTLESMAYGNDINPNIMQNNPFSGFTHYVDSGENGRRYFGVAPNGDFDAKAFVPGEFTQMDDEMMKRLYLYVNKRSQFGADVERELVNRGYQEFVNKTSCNFLGAESCTIEITEVTSTSDSGDRVLADPAGRGVGFDKAHYIDYDNNEPGYIFSMGCVVPITNTVQRVDLSLTGYDFTTKYSQLTDGLGFEGLGVCGVGYMEGFVNLEDDVRDDSLFGLLPTGSKYKIRKNTLNGAFANPKDALAIGSYSLDRLIYRYPLVLDDVNEGTFKCGIHGNTMNIDGVEHRFDIPNSGLNWKKTLAKRYYGNFDRIFNQKALASFDSSTDDDGTYTDGFISDFTINFDFRTNMLPISQTWQTLEDNSNPQYAKSVNVD